MIYENVVPSGFFSLDNVLDGGFHCGDVVFIAARPAMGKSTFALQCAAGMARKAKKKICYLSLEMSVEGIKRRYADLCAENSLIIDDEPSITPSKILAKLEKIPNLGAVIIDYFDLIKPDEGDFYWDVLRKLKIIAKEFCVPVICTKQLSRTLEQRQDCHPVLSDFSKHNDELERNSDVVLFLYRDAYYNTDEAASCHTAEVIVAKNQHGECKSIPFQISKDNFKFTDDSAGNT